MLRIVAGLLALLISASAYGQGAVLQGGGWTSGHAPMYVGAGTGQAVVQDSGPAGGGVSGLGFSELLLTARGTGTPPFSAQASGPGGSNFCNFDAPTSNPTGYHYICISPNATVAGLTGTIISTGSGGATTALPFYLCTNGTCVTPGGGINGITVGATTVGSATNGYLLYDNNGVLGNLNPATLSGSLIVGSSVITGGTTTRVLFDNAGTLGEYSITGTGNVAMSASPTFTGTLTAATLSPTTVNGFTLGGTIAGGGNQINNVIIGNSTPLAGAFTSLGFSTTLTGTSTNSACGAIGRQGATTPVWQLDCSVASQVTGWKMTGRAAGARTALTVTSSGTNEGFEIDGKGNATSFINATSTGLLALGNGGGGVALSSALTYASVTLSNSVTGTGSMVLSASPAFTGTPTAPTAAVDTNTTQIATTAMVLGQAAAATPLGANPTAAVGTSTRYARADHVHPGRELLSSARTYYVRSDGNDSTCSGQTNAAAASAPACAFLTWAKAVSTITGSIDFGGQVVTVTNGNAATYTTGISMTSAWTGGGTIVFDLGGGVLNVAAGIAFSLSNFVLPGQVTVQNGTVQGGFGIVHSAIGTLQLGTGMVFGPTTSRQMESVGPGSYISATAVTYSITGSADGHMLAADQGRIDVPLVSVTISAGVAFGTTGTKAFASSYHLGQIIAGAGGYTCSGACSGITGRTYYTATNAVIDTASGGANYFPGATAGTGTNSGASPYGLYN